MFGLGITLFLLIPMYFIPWHIPGTDFWQEIPRYEDALDALAQIGNSWLLVVFVMGNVISIAFFNFTGLTVKLTWLQSIHFLRYQSRVEYLLGLRRSNSFHKQLVEKLGVPRENINSLC